MSGNRYWTPDEEQFLRDNYLQMSADEVAKALNRTLSSVYKKFYLMKLASAPLSEEELEKIPRHRRPFSAREDTFIIENYGYMELIRMSEAMDRTTQAIARRAAYLGIHKPTVVERTTEELPMSPADIVIEFSQAKNKPVQIGILADLNDTTKKHIRKILKENGCKLPTTRAKRTIPK